jgi:hypothetical protein
MVHFKMSRDGREGGEGKTSSVPVISARPSQASRKTLTTELSKRTTLDSI